MDTATTPNGVSSAAPIVLDDTATPDLIGTEPAAPAAEPAKTDAPKAPDPDEAVLELSRRSREAQAATKAATARQQELDGYIAKHKSFAGILDLAKSDPIAFVEKIADAAGLDVDTAIEAYTTRKAGGQRDLSPEERIKRFETEQARREQEARDREEREQAERQKADGEAAVQRHHEAIKSLAKGGEENFPLFNDDPDGNAAQAFDLMVLAHQDGKELSYAAAVSQIEKQLRADTERRAARLGFKPTGQTGQPPTKPTPTAPTPAQPRQTQASAAPIEPTQTIKSDEEIAADWTTMFRRSG
jgi:hypothetical protein